MTMLEKETTENRTVSYEGTKLNDRKERPLTKVIMRRLPPTMDKESFLSQVSPIPKYDYLYFVKADMSLGENAFARAYINFTNTDDIYIFKEKFDGYVFLDAKGNEYVAVVEFASFQRIPKKRAKRPDPKSGTVETDPYYMEFLESLKEAISQVEEKPEYSYNLSSQETKKTTSTPLLEFVKQRKLDRQKIREEKREERKRRDLEKKRLKDEERRRRKEGAEASFTKTSSTVTSDNKTVITKPSEGSSESSVKAEEEKCEESEKTEEKSQEETPAQVLKSNKDQYKADVKKTTVIKQRGKNFQNDKHSGEYYKYPSYKYKRNDYKYQKPVDTPRKEFDVKKKETETPKTVIKKVKKYSEIREERKNEARKAEIKKQELLESGGKEASDLEKTNPSTKDVVESGASSKSAEKIVTNDAAELTEVEGRGGEDKIKRKENDPRVQRRIRNKDRPAMAIYQPGMLSKHKKHSDIPEDSKKSEEKNNEEAIST